MGLRDVYGVQVRRFVPLVGQAQTLAALEQGIVDVAVMFTTDGALGNPDVVALSDDRSLQPVENVVPVVSAARSDATVRDWSARSTRYQHI